METLSLDIVCAFSTSSVTHQVSGECSSLNIWFPQKQSSALLAVMAGTVC